MTLADVVTALNVIAVVLGIFLVITMILGWAIIAYLRQLVKEREG